MGDILAMQYYMIQANNEREREKKVRKQEIRVRYEKTMDRRCHYRDYVRTYQIVTRMVRYVYRKRKRRGETQSKEQASHKIRIVG